MNGAKISLVKAMLAISRHMPLNQDEKETENEDGNDFGAWNSSRLIGSQIYPRRRRV